MRQEKKNIKREILKTQGLPYSMASVDEKKPSVGGAGGWERTKRREKKRLSE